jgi:hypothetical protein
MRRPAFEGAHGPVHQLPQSIRYADRAVNQLRTIHGALETNRKQI